MKKDTVFKGCMRPQMIMGVPLIPFMLVCGPILIMATRFSLLLLLTLPLAIFIMRILTKKDELYFDLIGVRILARLNTRGCVKTNEKGIMLSAISMRRNKK
jgi:type IV secretion system protein VirB3